MQTRAFLQRRHNPESSDRLTANMKRRSDRNQLNDQPQPQSPPVGFDLSNIDLFSHAPQRPSVPSAIQAKLSISAPNDQYEQEADRVAEQVLSMPDAATQQPVQRAAMPEEEEIQAKPLAATITPLIQREAIPEEEEAEPLQAKAIQREAMPEEEAEPLQAKAIQREAMPEEEEEPVQAKLIQRETMPEEKELQRKPSLQRATDGNWLAGKSLEERLSSSQRGGAPLPEDVRSFMEPRFGVDFSGVRVHAGSESVQMNRELNAQAFTHKQDVYFGAGRAPGNDALTAHELTHVVQQTGAVQLKCSTCAQEEKQEQNVQRQVADPSNIHRQSLSSPESSSIQRSIVLHNAQTTASRTVNEEVLNNARLAEVERNLIGGPLQDLVDPANHDFFVSLRYRRTLIHEILQQLHANSQRFFFMGEAELASEVRKRALVSIYMRQSQGSSRGMRAFGYPNRTGTRGCGPRVNLAAQSYWGPVQDPDGDYHFNLSPAGKTNPYQALVTLFTEQARACDRTLIHCDYVVSLIQYRAMAETMGVARFNQEVISGRLPMVLKWDGFSDITSGNPASATSGDFQHFGFQEVTVSSASDFMLGDHVVMFNHESYDNLNEVKADPWRLENAVITRTRGGQLEFQGHGYFAPLPLNHFIDSMMSWYNRKVDEARGYIRSRNLAALQAQFPSIVQQGSQWVIRYQKLGGECDGIWYTRPLQHVTRGDFSNPFANPCDGQIMVRRPLESVRNVQ